MKIIALQAENIKKLVAVEIKPDGNLVQITGKNGQGKTSVLDAIWWALAGTKNLQEKPIREGQEMAKIRLDLGEVIVTRNFKVSQKGETTSSITVENADGAKFSSPQKMLDSFLGELTFDPLAFSRMEPKQRIEVLKKFVPDVDFDAIKKQQAQDYETRRDLNREAKKVRSAADEIEVMENCPTDMIDDDEVIEELSKATKHNQNIKERQERRAAAEERVLECKEQAHALLEEAKGLEEKLKNAAPLPDPIDEELIVQRGKKAKEINDQVRKYKDKQKFLSKAEELEVQSRQLTDVMEARQKEVEVQISKAKLPVDGLNFGEQDILLKGIPFSQASDAEQLRTSIAIAMALNPTLRVVRVRDGSLLDEDSMAMLEEMANKKDYQVWVEKVDSSGKVGFVMENGEVHHAKG